METSSITNGKIRINQLQAEYTSTFHFKTKVIIKATKEQGETKGTYKYTKGTQSSSIDEILDIVINSQPGPEDSQIQFTLGIYTKTGFKPAGVGEIALNSIKHNNNTLVEIQKCPLGKGAFEVNFENDNANPINEDTSNTQKKLIEENEESKKIINQLENTIKTLQEENEKLNKVQSKVFTAPTSISNVSNNGGSNEQLKEKDKIIAQLKSKIDYYIEEATEQKSIINDITMEKKKITEEKNEMIRQLREEQNKLLESHEDKDIKISQGTNELKQIQEAQNNSNTKVTDIQKKSSMEISKLTSEITEMKKLIQNINNDMIIKEETIKKLNAAIITLEETVKEVKSEKEDITIKLQSLETTTSEEIKSKDNEITSGKARITCKDNEIELGNNQIDETSNYTKTDSDGTLQLKTEGINKEKTITELKKQLVILETSSKKYENQMQIIETNTVSNVEISRMSEKKLKDDIIKGRGVIDAKRGEIQKLMDINETGQSENKKGKNEINVTENAQINNEDFFDQIQEMQKTFAERENKIVSEKNLEINNLKKENDMLLSEVKKSSSSNDISKYLSEISRGNEQKASIEEDLKYYKELNGKFVDTEKKSTLLETDNAKLRNVGNDKTSENEAGVKQNKELVVMSGDLEKEVLTSKEKGGELLNELADISNKNTMLQMELNARNDKKKK